MRDVQRIQVPVGSFTRGKTNVCFSATANFVAAAFFGAVGIVTLTKVKHRRELLFASVPILFAVHQFIEGFVWSDWMGSFADGGAQYGGGIHAICARAFAVSACR